MTNFPWCCNFAHAKVVTFKLDLSSLRIRTFVVSDNTNNHDNKIVTNVWMELTSQKLIPKLNRWIYVTDYRKINIIT